MEANNNNDLAEITDAQLLDLRKKAKSGEMVNAALIGLFIGIAIYSVVKNGIGFFTFFPLVFIYMLIKSRYNRKQLEEEINKRNLK